MKTHLFQWAIVGAGPAGIAAIGKLLDTGISPKHILWIDPHFTVGDLGARWCHVSSNTKVALFKRFLLEARAFSYHNTSIEFTLNQLPPDDTCLLNHVVEPLQWITDHLVQTIHPETTMIHDIRLSNRTWSLYSKDGVYQAKNVILATGATPLSLNYPNITSIPFDAAIDKTRLSQMINKKEVCAVFGSSHSAIIILHHLVDLGIKKIINFYRTPCRYAMDTGDGMLFDNTGLKGDAAAWAKEHIDGVLPPNLSRYINNDENLAHHLPSCDKAIYAIGFQRREHIQLGGYEHKHYNPHVGIIGPGLFGLGIAYPEKKTDDFGQVEYQVGLWKFMTYLNKILPIWLQYST
jgi:hypothetical protein